MMVRRFAGVALAALALVVCMVGPASADLDWAGATTAITTAGSAAMTAAFLPIIGLFALLIGLKLLKKVVNKGT